MLNKGSFLHYKRSGSLDAETQTV